MEQRTQLAEDNKYGLESKQWFLKNSETGALVSPWHDLEMESSLDEENMVCGVIEITKGTSKKLECFKEIEGNPVMQDYSTVNGKKEHRVYI